MSVENHTLSWRAPSWRTGVGIACLVLGLSCAVVFGLLGVLVEHTPRTEDVPATGAAAGVIVAVVGFAIWHRGDPMTVDFVRGEVRLGPERLADLSKTCAVLMQEVKQVVIGTSGGRMETRSWSLHLVQDHLDEERLARLADPDEADSAVVTLMRGVMRRSVERVAPTLARNLEVPVFTLDAEGEVKAGQAADPHTA